MINQIVQVIAPKRVVDQVEVNEPDLGPDITVGGADRVLREPQWAAGIPPKYWWIASVHAEDNQPLIDWNATPGNIGWVTRAWEGTHNAPTDADANKIWAHIRAIIETETPPAHNLWWVGGALRNGATITGPDMDDPTIQPTISDWKMHIDPTNMGRVAGLWSGTSSATNPQLAAWLAAHNDLGWKGSLPALGSAEGRLLVRKIAQLANNSSKFQGE